MPDPNPAVADAIRRGTVNLSDAPASLDETMFDQLFPADPQTPPVAASQTPPAPATQEPPVTQTPPAPVVQTGPFLKGATSVYQTPEAAIEGINQKDALIEQLRQRYALTTGIDPITGRPVNAQTSPAPTNYYQQPDRYVQDLVDSSKKGPEAYRDVQSKFITDTLEPLKPLIQRAAREQAVEQLSGEIKDIGTFITSPAYQKALEANPELKVAISTAETDTQWHHRLGPLYKIAYYTGQGMQLPELLKQSTSAPAPTTSTSRPALSAPSTSAPAPSADQPSFRDLKGIRATIAAMESKGVKLDF